MLHLPHQHMEAQRDAKMKDKRNQRIESEGKSAYKLFLWLYYSSPTV